MEISRTTDVGEGKSGSGESRPEMARPQHPSDVLFSHAGKKRQRVGQLSPENVRVDHERKLMCNNIVQREGHPVETAAKRHKVDDMGSSALVGESVQGAQPKSNLTPDRSAEDRSVVEGRVAVDKGPFTLRPSTSKKADLTVTSAHVQRVRYRVLKQRYRALLAETKSALDELLKGRKIVMRIQVENEVLASKLLNMGHDYIPMWRPISLSKRGGSTKGTAGRKKKAKKKVGVEGKDAKDGAPTGETPQSGLPAKQKTPKVAQPDVIATKVDAEGKQAKDTGAAEEKPHPGAPAKQETPKVTLPTSNTNKDDVEGKEIKDRTPTEETPHSVPPAEQETPQERQADKDSEHIKTA